MSWSEEITKILNEGYGDAAETELDRQVAERIEKWAIDKVALIVHSAGGRVGVDLRDWTTPPELRLYKFETPHGFGLVTRVGDEPTFQAGPTTFYTRGMLPGESATSAPLVVHKETYL